jgi:DNA-binding MarR family transcriptional regulator/GNAT superfamily N-acetyltransferase
MSHPLIDRARSFSRAVTRGFGVLDDDYLGRARPFGESRLLFEIGEAGTSAAALRARLGLDSGYLSRLLRSLERQGLVATRADPSDRRARLVELTESGLQELDLLNEVSDEAARRIVAPLNPTQQSRLAEAMATIEQLLTASAILVREESPTGRHGRDCLRQYYAELESRFDEGFSPDYADAPSLDEFEPPCGAFLIMTLHGEAVGCGGLKRLSEERAYIKRMWISPAVRGLRLGRRLLEALEQKAANLGYRIVCLETHKSLEEAQRLYRSAGYRKVEPFNDDPYADLWFERTLGN